MNGQKERIIIEKELRIIISGGGTGGHILPAVSIASAIIELRPDVRILFVGAEGRTEMQQVPDAGYKIIELPIAGFDRRRSWRNVSMLIKLARSRWKTRSIIKNSRPQVVIDVRGYASGPTLKTTGIVGMLTLIQGQSSYAGVTNKLLAQKAKTIYVVYDGVEKFFPADRIIVTGSPVRQNPMKDMPERGAALCPFNLQPDKKIVLIVGGSLGAHTINNTLTVVLATVKENNDIQFTWQTGKYYHPQVTEVIRAAGELSNLYVTDFTRDMTTAYAASDLVILRTGVGSILEFCLLHKPVALVPSPNVAKDHQTRNALALINKQIVIYVKDSEAEAKLVDVALNIAADDRKLEELDENIAKLALSDSARIIAQGVIKLAEAENQLRECKNRNYPSQD